MQLLDHTLPVAAENVAYDEALLAAAEEGSGADEVLRVWEPATPLVVVGRGSKIEEEVRVVACERLGIPIVRRSSGGLAIVTGPGCLMYAVVLSYDQRPELRMIERAHRFVLERIADELAKHVPGVCRAGISDLALPCAGALWKFSGNSLRCKRTHLLYHGTLLYDFDLSLIAECLLEPKRRPDYRGEREHGSFVANLSLDRETIVHTVRDAFSPADAKME